MSQPKKPEPSANTPRDHASPVGPGKTPGRAVRALLAAIVVLGTEALIGGQQSSSTPREDSVSPPAVAAVSPGAQPRAQEMLVSPDDLVEVSILDVPQMSRVYRVSPGGEIVLPLLAQPIAAVGLTPVQLSHVIAEKLREAGLVSNPYVTVEVKESRMHSVTVGGAVKRAQIYPLFGGTTLLDVLSQAGGLGDEAGNTATISRGAVALRALGSAGGPVDAALGAPPQVITVDLKRLLETGDPALNVDIYPGDRVMVQRAGIVYVVGAVNRVGGFPLKDDQEQMTVLKGIALAQDLKPTAIREKAVIIRKRPGAPEGREEIPVDLKKILAGRAPDAAMQPNDILFVPDSTGKKALRRAAEVAVQISTGLILWRR